MLFPANKRRSENIPKVDSPTGGKQVGLVYAEIELTSVDDLVLFRMADDSERKGEVVGPVEVRFENRSTTVRAVVLPGTEEPLLGSIPLEDLDVVIDPKEQRLIVNPKSPYIATKHLK